MFERIPHIRTFERTVAMEAILRKNAIKNMYVNDMEGEYSSIKHHLPHTCSSVLDIGCGIGGINIFLQKHYGVRRVTFYLLDKTRIEEKIFYGFRNSGAFYNSLDLARSFLILNGIEDAQVVLIEANEQNEIPIVNKIDLVISFLSWGFHYPVSTYLDGAHRILSQNGRLILDIRKGTNGEALVKEKFKNVQTILEHEEYIRLCCEN